ncbi:MAG: ROK family transcriptional regulator [Planctomycetota bacterium]|jgi:predicted NBD/HSP70 family sugar kinase|nr:ROK family transcriptional regulator [Planctomycetota bacterium]
MDVKKENRNRIYRLIARNGLISKADIARRLHVSLPTVAQNVRDLMTGGLVRENGNLESTGGRKAVALTRVKNARTAVGIDITRLHVAVVVVDMEGEVVARARKPLPFATNSAYARTLARVVNRLVSDSGIEKNGILGAGVALPGILDPDGRKVDSYVLPADGHECAAITRYLDYPCVFCNDANAAGLAELWTGQSPDTFVYLSLSNSVGGAVILDRKLYSGGSERAGEFGHLTLVRGGDRCYCGKRGCIDAYCNAGLLSDLAGGNIAAFFQNMELGDRSAQAAWNRYLDYLATAVNDLRMAFDCDVIIGGYVGAHMAKHLDDLRQRAAKLDTFLPDGSYVKVCRCLFEPSAVGAALLHIERFIDSI